MPRVAAACMLGALCLTVPAGAEFVAKPRDFQCVREWPKVRKLRIFHRNPKRLAKALEIAERGRPGERYPVGTIIQLVPFEAMVKRGGGFNRKGGGWEFFALEPTPEGTTIVQRGKRKVVSFGLSGANCQNCHQAARRFDFVCESGHGCQDINVSQVVADILQENDPRCQAAP